MSYDLAGLEAVIARHGKPYTNQSSHTWSYGYAIVSVSRWPDPNKHLGVSYRYEGDAGFGSGVRRTSDLSPPWGDTLAALVDDVLATGRTIECGKGVGLRDIGFEIHSAAVDESWEALANHVMGRGRYSQSGGSAELPLNLNPEYQRGPVWTEKQQRRFVGFALEGGEVNPIYVQRDRRYEKPEEVIDGQQRLRAITRFMEGEIPGDVYVPGEGWRELWYRDFNEIDRRSRRLSLRVVYGDWPLAERLRFYLRLNSGGVTHTEEELDKVRHLLASTDIS